VTGGPDVAKTANTAAPQTLARIRLSGQAQSKGMLQNRATIQ
jgi:hypothetical protein